MDPRASPTLIHEPAGRSSSGRGHRRQLRRTPVDEGVAGNDKEDEHPDEELPNATWLVWSGGRCSGPPWRAAALLAARLLLASRQHVRDARALPAGTLGGRGTHGLVGAITYKYDTLG